MSGFAPADTPPKRPRVRNPFERALVDRLNSHVCSPGMFQIRKSTDGFKWDIEQASILKPADIVACSSQFDPTPDPALERRATEAIDRYFSQETIVPSPFDVPPKRIPLPKEPEDVFSTPEGSKLSVWAQTHLSFPTELPPEVENVLKPFYNFAKDPNVSELDAAANASRRRKLNFEAEFSDEEESANSFSQYAQYSNMITNRGLKRALDVSMDSNINSEFCREVCNKSTSPILKGGLKTWCGSSEQMQYFKSPSISPIKHDSFAEANSSPESLKNNSHHLCEISAFSQSTPEKMKSDVLSKSEMVFVQTNFAEKSESKGHFEYDMDISNTSAYFDKDHNENPVNLMSTENQVLIDDKLLSSSKRKALQNISNIINDRNDRKSCLYDKKAGYENHDLSKIYHCLTPTRSVRRTFMTPCNKTPVKTVTISSPMQISIDSINLDTDKCPIKEYLISDNAVNLTVVQDAPSNMGYDFDDNSSHIISGVRKRTDSGFLDTFYNEKLSVANYKPVNSTVCVTDDSKSFQCSTSSIKWKRFDSGFHDETSSEFVSQVSCNDSLKFTSKVYSPIDEYLEDQKDFEDFHQFLAHENEGEPMQMTDIRTTNVALPCNYSSTPSKMQYKKNFI